MRRLGCAVDEGARQQHDIDLEQTIKSLLHIYPSTVPYRLIDSMYETASK